jgi:nucleoside-diphosphate-sugar epimerase
MKKSKRAKPIQLLLLGGSGFVGRALLREIATYPAGSVRVRALLRTPSAVPDYPFLEKVEGSLERVPRDLEPVGPYVLVHFAVKQIDGDGTGYLATNVEATRALLQTLGPTLAGIIYSSTMSVYGQGAQEGVTESAPPRPETALSRSRRQAEALIEEVARARRISAFLLRPRFVLGEGDRFVLPSLAKLLQKGISVASGAQRFSVIDVTDYARVIVRLAEHAAELHRVGAPVQEALNVGHAQPVSFEEIAGVLRETLGIPAPRWRLPVSARVTRFMRQIPLRTLDQVATRLELVGLSHWGDPSALAAKIGHDIVGQDPMRTVRHAAQRVIKS